MFFLVMNMALADVMLGAVSIPLFVYLSVGPYILFHFLDITFSQSLLIRQFLYPVKDVMPSIKHKTLSMLTFGIVWSQLVFGHPYLHLVFPWSRPKFI